MIPPLSELLTSREQAAAQNIKYYQPQQVCKHNHLAPRYTKCNRCVECMKKRYSRILQATPNWISNNDKEKIKQKQRVANILTKRTGIQYSVDHYYPIIGKKVSGLNIPINTQIITLEENMRKKNKHPDDFYK